MRRTLTNTVPLPIRLPADAESMARRLGDDGTLLGVLNLTFMALWVPDRFARTVAVSQEALTLAGRVGDPVARFWAAKHRDYAMRSRADRGGIDDALDLQALLAHEIGQPYLTGVALQSRCLHALLIGGAEEAERLASEALQIGSDTGQPDTLLLFGSNLITIRWHQGRVEEIMALVALAAADQPDHGRGLRMRRH